MKFFNLIVTLTLIQIPFLSQADEPDFIDAIRLGGETSILIQGQSVQAYRNPVQNLDAEQLKFHLEGDALFERTFSDDPLRKDFGLGPVFNHAACINCHNRDGRGALPIVSETNDWKLLGPSAVFLRISIENFLQEIAPIEKNAENGWGAPVLVPDYSTQLFQIGSWGLRDDLPGTGQARVWMKYEFSEFVYPDGQKVILRKPVFKITDAYSPRIYDADVRTSPRIGTPMIGLGLLEAIKEEDILAISQKDFSKEGVSGKPNWVFDIEKQLRGDAYPVSLGRFGLKANTPSVLHQSLGALRGDIGLTNYAFPDESIKNTPLYNDFIKKNPDKVKDIEASREIADQLVFYSQTLAVPTRRNVQDLDVRAGGRLFAQAKCTTCHTPSFITGPHKIPQLSNQKIFPFTDMLLHDMGEGLADGRQDFDANGKEWRTRSLWGVGQSKTVNPLAGFLHDGRARTLEEAVLWHGGEAQYSVQMFSNLSLAERSQVIKFLNSL